MQRRGDVGISVFILFLAVVYLIAALVIGLVAFLVYSGGYLFIAAVIGLIPLIYVACAILCLWWARKIYLDKE